MCVRKALIDDLCEYTGEPRELVLGKMARADQEAADLWLTLDEKGRRSFYVNHPSYIYGLTHWHTAFEYRPEWTAQILEFAAKNNLQTAWEFGCGIATDGLSLSEAGLAVDLFDVDQKGRDFVRWKIKKYGLKNALLLDKPRRDRPYDLVVLCDVIAHVSDPIDLIVTLAKSCRYLFYTEDFDIGVPAYPMHAKKPVNYDRVFQAAFRHVEGYVFESKTVAPRVAISPSPRELERADGGVKRVVEALARHLPGQGVVVVDPTAPCDFAHCHATSVHPKILIHGNHGFYPWDTTDKIGARVNHVLKQSIASAACVLAVSKLAPAEFESRLGVQAEIFPNGVDLEPFDELPVGEFASVYNLARPFFLWAKLTTEGVCDPAPALELARQMTDQEFIFTVAKGPVPANVKVVGKLPYPVMQRALKDCACLLATTKENFSVQVLEAMACSKPVLAFDHGGNAEAIVHKQTGYLAVDQEDLYRGALYCLNNAKRLGEAGRTRVERFYQWKDLVPILAKIYRRTYYQRILAQADGLTVSVIVPCYNAAETVVETLDSIYAQTFCDFEVIVVDDGSTDETWNVLHRYREALEERRSSLSLVRQKNARVAAARNKGITLAHGRYIVCVDADDRIAPTYLEKAVKALEEDWSIGLVYPDFQTFGESNALVRTREYDFESLKKGNFIVHAAMFKRTAWERVGGFKDINPSWEDYEFWINLGKHGFYGKRLPEPLFFYRKRAGVGRDHESQTHTRRLRQIVNSYHPDLYPTVVSVIIPCYNHAHYLEESIDSVLSQTYQGFEILVVDDGSTDGTEVRRQALKSQDPRIRVIRHPENKGLAEARNTGVRASVGSFILTLDADDRIRPTFLEKTVEMLESRADISIVYTDIEMFGGVSKVSEMPEYDFDDLLKKNIMACTSLYRRVVFDDVGGYDPRMDIAWEDYLFWIQAGKIGHCGARLDEPLFLYRRDRPSMIIKAHERIAEVRQRLYELEPDLFKRGIKPVACCGRRVGTAATRAKFGAHVVSSSPGSFVGQNGLVELAYVGKERLLPIKGAETGAHYEFKKGQTLYVDPRDAGKMLDTGLFHHIEESPVVA